MTAGNLPEELLIDILSRLPVKSIVRFRCIHKTWNSLTKSSDFVITHSQNPKNKAHGSIFLPYNDSGNLSFRSFDPNSFDVRADHLLPFDILKYSIHSSCDGLLCLRKYDTCSIVLYNPYLRQYKILPTSNLHTNSDKELDFFGFGYDSTSNDYKVVREYCGRDDEVRLRTLTEVYSLRTNSWRKLGSYIPHDIQPSSTPRHNCFFNRAIHSLACNVHNYLVSFDVCDEEFHLFLRPKCKGYKRIHVYGDLLSIFDLVRDEGVYCCDIWVMKEYGVEDSWVRLHSIKLFFPRPHGINLLGFGMNGEIIFNKWWERRIELLVVSNYNKHEKLIKTIKVENHYYFAFACMDSLVSLDQGNQ